MSDFEEIISSHCVRLYNLCQFSLVKDNRASILNRRFLGKLHMESTWMEETLDGAGARHNEKWFPFREGVSAIKLFSSVTYDVLHVQKYFSNYQLLEKGSKFELDIEKVIEELYLSIVNASNYLVKRAKKCGMHSGSSPINSNDFLDLDISTVLEKDRNVRHIPNPGKSLIYLATQFIDLEPQMLLFNKISSLKKSEYKNFIPDTVSEEKLRLVLVRFHNLQSLYDTYLSESDIEVTDSRLKVLRGHISFIFHMLKSATEFSHYYERHIVPRSSSIFFNSILSIPTERFLEITIDFFIGYFIFYFKGAIKLCQNVIDCYAEIGEVTVPIPAYRGFHVRPSSLISKIINYYGGKVKMIVNGAEYDPSTPLELFRVNEEINAIKRVQLFEIVNKKKLITKEIEGLLRILSKRESVIIYDTNYTFDKKKESESLEEFVKRVFAFLLASGKIDINMDISVKFIGDKRSLKDIEILAKNSYGEDKYGKNIPLPVELSYLKR